MILACVAPSSFHFCVGACMAFSAILIPQLEAPDSDIKVNKEDISWIASVITLVVPVGSLLTGALVDRIGRLNSLRLSCVPHVLGWAVMALAKDFHILMLGRLITGFSLAFAANPALVYITEVARPSFRGFLMCFCPSMTSLGMVLVYGQGPYLHWRVICWVTVVCCALPLLFTSLCSVESPAWLISKGKPDRARKSLVFLLHDTALAEQRLAELVKDQNEKRERAGNKKRSAFVILFRGLLKPTGYKPFFLLTSLFIFQQLSGIYITIFYAVTFFQEVGAAIDPYISTIGIGVVRLIMGIVTMFLMRKFGRRTLFIASGSGMAIFVFIAGYFTKQIAEGKMETNNLPIVFLLLYLSLGVVGFMSIPWTMTAELFPIEIRGMAQSMMVAIINIITFIVLKYYPFLGDWVGGSYAIQWLFSGLSVCGIIFIIIFMPETHKKTLADIEDYFTNHTVYILSKYETRRKPAIEEKGEEMVKLKETI